MTPTDPHDLECALAAYGVLLEQAEKRGDRLEAKAIRKELKVLVENSKCTTCSSDFASA